MHHKRWFSNLLYYPFCTIVIEQLNSIDNYMAQKQLIKIACTACKRVNYWSRKNKKLVERKIELKKFCKWCKKTTKHKESKK